MSTRAIIAYPVKDGYITAWQWDDGYPENLGIKLKREFTKEDDVKELLSYHSFSCVVSEQEKNELIKEFPDTLTEKEFIRLSNGMFILFYPFSGGVIEGEDDGFFLSVEEMLQCDLNYVYVYNSGKWEVYK